jgi:hypothetical protein
VSGTGDTVTTAFDGALDSARAGLPTLLLVVGGPGEADAALAHEVGKARLERGARLLVVQPSGDAAFDPVERTLHGWTTGIRQVAMGEGNQRIALEWIGALPAVGDALAAGIETVEALLRRRKRHRDPAVDVLLRAARRKPVIVTISHLQLATAGGANRLASAISAARQGTQLLIAGSLERPPQGRARPHILDLAGQLPSDRVRVVEMPEGRGRLGTLAESSPEALDAVCAAAAIGMAFHGADVAERLGIDELAAEDRLSLAVREGIIRVTGTVDLPDGDIATGYVFAEESVRDVLLGTDLS